MNKNSRLVYSTEVGRVCPKCKQSKGKCTCGQKKRSPAIPSDGTIRIQREVKGRRGKTASVLYGCHLNTDELKKLAARLKQVCGTGGSVKEGVIIIQGDHRQKILTELKSQGLKAKLSGG